MTMSTLKGSQGSEDGSEKKRGGHKENEAVRRERPSWIEVKRKEDGLIGSCGGDSTRKRSKTTRRRRKGVVSAQAKDQ